MTVKVKSVSEASKYWVEGSGGRAARYASEAPAAADTWQKNAQAAAATYKAAVTAGNIDKMFSGGIARVGSAKFQRKVRDVGAARFRPGVEAAKSDYETGVGPMLDTIAGLSLPDKKVRGDPANLARVSMIALALNKKRISLRAAG